MCMYVCTYVCMYVCMNIRLYTYMFFFRALRVGSTMFKIMGVGS